MTIEQTTSWIFLSIALGSQESPITFSQISAIADGINHAVPNHKELQTSISWLKQENLITQTGKKYSISDFGKEIFKQAEKQKTIFNIWKNLENEFIKKNKTSPNRRLNTLPEAW